MGSDCDSGGSDGDDGDNRDDGGSSCDCGGGVDGVDNDGVIMIEMVMSDFKNIFTFFPCYICSRMVHL